MASTSRSVSRIVAKVQEWQQAETSDRYATFHSHLMQLGMLGSHAERFPVRQKMKSSENRRQSSFSIFSLSHMMVFVAERSPSCFS